MRIYNGKPMVNSVNGKQENMDAVFPLIKRYGGVVIGLTIDEDGIPATADGRVRVAGKIIEEAKKYGIDKKDIVIDVLAMTISLNRKVRRSRWKHSKKSGRFMVSVRFLVYRTFRSVFRTVRQLIQISIRWPCRMD